jgi:hypothetical protein
VTNPSGRTDSNSTSAVPRRKGPKAKYPWAQWFDGEWHEAPSYVYGPECTTHSFVTQLHLKARRTNMWVETETKGSTVRFRFHVIEAQRA